MQLFSRHHNIIIPMIFIGITHISFAADKPAPIRINKPATSAVIKNMTSGMSGIKSQMTAIDRMTGQIQLTMNSFPRRPERKLNETTSEFQSRLKAYDAAVKKAQQDLKQAQGHLEAAIKKLAQTQRDLRKLMNQDLPSAQRKDEQTMQDYHQRERDSLSSQAADQRKGELRLLLKQSERKRRKAVGIVRDSRLFLNKSK